MTSKMRRTKPYDVFANLKSIRVVHLWMGLTPTFSLPLSSQTMLPAFSSNVTYAKSGSMVLAWAFSAPRVLQMNTFANCAAKIYTKYTLPAMGKPNHIFSSLNAELQASHMVKRKANTKF